MNGNEVLPRSINWCVSVREKKYLAKNSAERAGRRNCFRHARADVIEGHPELLICSFLHASTSSRRLQTRAGEMCLQVKHYR
jgi:hypothetical protein